MKSIKEGPIVLAQIDKESDGGLCIDGNHRIAYAYFNEIDNLTYVYIPYNELKKITVDTKPYEKLKKQYKKIRNR